MLAGCLLAALTYVPLFMALKAVINPGMAPSVTTLSLGAATAAVAILGAAALTSLTGNSAPPEAAAQADAASTLAYEPYTAARLEALRAEFRCRLCHARAYCRSPIARRRARPAARCPNASLFPIR